MNPISDLESLCYPILRGVCNYWQLVSIGSEPTMEQFRHDIESQLENAKTQAGKNSVLAQEYARIERPLIFFIDYMVKEGNFPFRREWRELGRTYNELSGDEKFFNLLAESLDDPKEDSTFKLYYLMLGLGFDGVYRSKQEYIEGYMKQCLERFPPDFDLHEEPVVKVSPKHKLVPGFKKPRRFTLHLGLILSLIFMVICFVINLLTFRTTTASYRQTLSSTVLDAIPRSDMSLYETPQGRNIPK